MDVREDVPVPKEYQKEIPAKFVLDRDKVYDELKAKVMLVDKQPVLPMPSLPFASLKPRSKRLEIK